MVGLVAQTLQFGAALTLVPFMVTRMSPGEIGIWYVFVGLQTLAIICDFGFLPSFTRAFALAQAGATALIPRGLNQRTAMDGHPNPLLLAEVRGAAKLFYRLLGLAALIAGVGLGLPYVTYLATVNGISVGETQVAWTIFVVGIALNLMLQWVSPALLGMGQVEHNYLTIIANRGSFSVLGIAALAGGGGLVALACVSVVAPVGARLVAQRFLLSSGSYSLAVVPQRRAVYAVLRTLWPNAARMGVVSLSGFLITRYGLFAVSTFLGLAAGGSYALSLQMLSAVAAVSQLPMQVAMPRLVAARVEGQRVQLRGMYLAAMSGYAALYFIGALLVVLLVPVLLDLINSRVALLPLPILALMAVIMMLEGFHSNAAFFITTGNDVPFVGAALISGLAVAGSTTVVGWLGYGIAAMIACQGLVQLAYNNWRWPTLAWKEIAET